ncbi:oxidoreductase [Phaffia rhodozyma]|uniref:3-dehydrosphinganine reductase n=1 Tax=Phaffia rhodozyma TaxID=264483 RepID=A0A0F7SNX3_PHARH|nr:oxidoreductase [Phaffia rhodozyma]
MFSILKPKWNAKGKHCIVTGGSSGLGFELAALLLQRGADVTIIARNQQRLDEAIEKLKPVSSSSQSHLHAISGDLSSSTGAREALEQAIKYHPENKADAVFMCAGASYPGFFLSQPDSDFTSTIDQSYYTALWTSRAAAQLIARQILSPSTSKAGPPSSPPKLVFVASTLSFLSFAGYSSYSPAKYALRGLSDALRNELQLVGIDVHCFFPAGIITPGFEKENTTKPQLCRIIEGSDEPLMPAKVASHLYKGLEKGQFHISYDIATEIFRSSAGGLAPSNGVVLDTLLSFIGRIGIPIWRIWADKQVRDYRAEYLQKLQADGFFN